MDTEILTPKTIELLTNLGYGVLILVLGWLAISIILQITKKALMKSRLDEALHTFIRNSIKVVLWIIVIIAMLTKLNVPTTSMVAVLSAGGAAIALALKDSLGNVAGGIIILINKPFNKGDTIEVQDTTGIVDSIDLLTTQLHTFDNKVVTIPNGTLTTSILTNYSTENLRRVDCLFGISQQADLLKAKDILLTVADQCPWVCREPAYVIGVSEQKESGLWLDLKVWCSTEEYYDVKYYLEENVKLAFDEAGIITARSKMDVHFIR